MIGDHLWRVIKMCKYEDCLGNFEKIINSGDPSVLSPKGFTLVSEMSAIATTRLLKKKWFELLEEYNKIEELYSYVKEEFMKHYEKTANASVQEFIFNHKTITQDVGKYFGNTKIKNDCGFTRKGLSNKNELIKYFRDLVDELGYVPNYSEFMEKSKIKIYQFMSLLSDDKTWESVIKNTFDNDTYLKYLERVKEKQIEVAKIGKASQPLMDEKFIETEFRRVFDDCFKKYNTYPTRRLFNKLSILSDGAYRKRYKESWNKTVLRYGYDAKNMHLSEKYALGLVSEVTGVDFIPQMKWDWLVSKKGTKLPVDAYYKELNLAIEFDGAQHRQPLVNMGGIEKYITQVENDQIKNSEIPKHGIQLIRIDSREPWHDKDYISKLLIKNNIPTLTPTK
jgi:hypothetical protein